MIYALTAALALVACQTPATRELLALESLELPDGESRMEAAEEKVSDRPDEERLCLLTRFAHFEEDHEAAASYGSQLFLGWREGNYEDRRGKPHEYRRRPPDERVGSWTLTHDAIELTSHDFIFHGLFFYARSLVALNRFSDVSELYEPLRDLLRKPPAHWGDDAPEFLLIISQALLLTDDKLTAERLLRDLIKNHRESDTGQRAHQLLEWSRGTKEFDPVNTYYQGKYAKKGEIKATLRELPKAHEGSLEVVKRTLGLQPLPDRLYSIQLSDSTTYGAAAVTSSDRFLENQMPVVRLFTEGIVQNTYDWRKTLTHEMIHALMHANMGKRFNEIPSWVHEGLAVYGAEQGPGRIRTALSSHLYSLTKDHLKTKIDRLVDGLEDDEAQDGLDYSENYLAFEMLVTTQGEQTFFELVHMMFDGANHEQVLALKFDRNFDTFREAAKTHARRRYEAIIQPTLPLLREAFSERPNLRFFPTAGALLVRPETPKQKLERLRSFLHDKKPSLSKEEKKMLQRYEGRLRDAIKDASEDAYFLPNLEFELAMVAMAQDRYGDAARRAKDVARQFSDDSPLAADALFCAGAAYMNMNKNGDARQCFVRVSRDFPGSAYSYLASSLLREL